MLSASDPLPLRPRRVIVAGTTGTGKTTLVRQIASRLDLRAVELDALHHGPGWTPRPDFLADVDAFSSTHGWVTEWQYPAGRPLLAGRADLMVWLDLPFRTTLRRVTTRTVRRRLRREVLWNGNLEPPLRTFLTDREHVVRWAISTRNDLVWRVAEVQRTRPDLPTVRLRTQRDVDEWVGRLG